MVVGSDHQSLAANSAETLERDQFGTAVESLVGYSHRPVDSLVLHKH